MAVPRLVHLELNTVALPLVCLEVFLVVLHLKVHILVLLVADLVHPVVQDQGCPVLYHLEVSMVLLAVRPLRVNMLLHLVVSTVVHLAVDFLDRPRVLEALSLEV